jgi:hypothetical protein
MAFDSNAVNQDALMACPACRTSVKIRAFCSKCGANLATGGTAPPPPAVAIVPPAESGAQANSGFVGDLIEQHWPAIQKVVRERIAPKVMSAANDDDVVAMVAGTLHGLLPLPVRLVIRPQRLTNWCLQNRDRILRILDRGGPPS